ncbi:MAG: 3'-5' exonuclease, partial [Vicingaceae bacterium]|nr:3'-5' exonuclease [Vicingaceae bacterium]
VLNNIINTIKQVVSDGFKLSDVAILTLSNKDGSEIASHLLENDLNVISSESLLLNNSEEVQFLLNLFRFIAEPKHKNTLVQLLNYLTQHVYADDMFALFETYPEDTINAYLNSKGVQIDYPQISNYSLYELAECLVVTFGFEKHVDVYVQFFLDKIQEYAARNDNSIINFVEWWEGKAEKFSIVIPEGIDAVRVMSIHKSKGLEFPVVIYPFATTIVKTSEKFFWTNETNIPELKSAIIPIKKELMSTNFASVYEAELNKSRLDLVNVLYVALTRPKDRLYVISQTTKKPSPNGSVTDYLMQYCTAHEDNKVGDNHYQFGAFAPHVATQEKTTQDVSFDKVAYNNWREKIKISYQAPLVWETENPETIGEHGTIIHNILSRVETINDIDAAIEIAVRKGLITAAESPVVKTDLENVFKIDGVADLFTDFDELKNERSILLPSGETYQPDRVVVKNGKTYLIDYKTGEPNPSHEKQVTEYGNLLTQMGYENIVSYLLYIKSGELIGV